MPPPNNIPAERHVLGALLLKNLPFPVNLKPSDFFEPKHQDVAAAILYLQSDGKAADEATVPAYLHSAGSSVDYSFINDLTADAGFKELRQEHIDMVNPIRSPSSFCIGAPGIFNMIRTKSKWLITSWLSLEPSMASTSDMISVTRSLVIHVCSSDSGM